MSINNRDLNLSRPLVFFDLETTGVKPEADRIIEIAAIKITPEGQEYRYYSLVNPSIPIPIESLEIHGITDEKVAKAPLFSDIAFELADFFQDSDLAGYNIKKFDVPLLLQEFHRCKLYPIQIDDIHIVDSCSLFMLREPRTLTAAARFYANIESFDAHSAMADIEASMAVLKGQLNMYDDLGLSPKELAEYLKEREGTVDLCRKFLRNGKGEVVFNFGKNFGRPVSEDPDYLKWIRDNQSMPLETRVIAKRLLTDILKD
jgi:DNA polymerase-3 subunit epsilon